MYNAAAFVREFPVAAVAMGSESGAWQKSEGQRKIMIRWESSMNRWVFVTSVVALCFAGQVWSADQAVVDQYKKTCAVCHGSGAAGAPKTGSAELWAPRLEKGMETLVDHAKNGFNAMPPKGMCFDCSDDDFKALIEYMATGQ